MIERSQARLFFWLIVLFVAYTAIAWTITDYETCVSSMMVEVGQTPVVNGMTCE